MDFDMNKLREVRSQVESKLTEPFGCALVLTDHGYVIRVEANKEVLSTIPSIVEGVRIQKVLAL